MDSLEGSAGEQAEVVLRKGRRVGGREERV